MYKYLLSLMVLLPFSTTLLAQDADENEDAEEAQIEEVVTTGIKRSLIDAISIKRDNQCIAFVQAFFIVLKPSNISSLNL